MPTLAQSRRRQTITGSPRIVGFLCGRRSGSCLLCLRRKEGLAGINLQPYAQWAFWDTNVIVKETIRSYECLGSHIPHKSVPVAQNILTSIPSRNYINLKQKEFDKK